MAAALTFAALTIRIDGLGRLDAADSWSAMRPLLLSCLFVSIAGRIGSPDVFLRRGCRSVPSAGHVRPPPVIPGVAG